MSPSLAQSPRWKRASRAVAFAIVFALIATITSAWLLAFVPPTWSPGPLSLPVDSKALSYSFASGVLFLESTFPAHRLEWAPASRLDPQTNFDVLQERWRQTAEAFVMPPPGLDGPVPHEWLVRPDLWPSYAGPRGTLADSGLEPTQGLSIDARGFPFPALRCSTIIIGPPPMQSALPVSHPVRNGIVIRHPSGAMKDSWTALPLKPIASGFLLDIAFFFLLFFAAKAAFAAVRQSIRSGRAEANLCPHCAYPMSGTTPSSPCPECGTILAP